MINIFDDAHLESNEQFNCILTLIDTDDPSIQIHPAIATVTIVDDDGELL